MVLLCEPLSAALLSISFQIECCRDDVKPSEEEFDIDSIKILLYGLLGVLQFMGKIRSVVNIPWWYLNVLCYSVKAHTHTLNILTLNHNSFRIHVFTINPPLPHLF